MSRTVQLIARLVFPVAGPPIREGVVTVRDGTIVDVAAQCSVDQPPVDAILDLGGAALLPGLVNAHTHLELSDAERPLGESGDTFADWIRRVITHRFESPLTVRQRVELGLQECRSFGTSLVGDIVQPFETDDNRHSSDECSSPATVDFLELIAPGPERVDETWQQVEPFLARTESTFRGLSPHSPYSTCGPLLERAIELSQAQKIPLAMHLAESSDEMRLLREGDGPIRELLEQFAPWDTSNLAGRHPMDYIRMLGDAHRAIIIHGNYLDEMSIAMLAQRRDRMSVVFCPRCHARFGHPRYPLEEMLRDSVRVALGTDGRVSTSDLNVWAEMQRVADDYPNLSGETILQMGTLDGAEALGQGERYGAIRPGAAGSFAVARFPGSPYDILDSVDPVRRLLHSIDSLSTLRAVDS